LIKNVFITGGLGQDGIILTKLLNKNKSKLYIITKTDKKTRVGKINFIKSNLLNKKKIDKIFKKITPHIIVHLASNNPSYMKNDYNLFYKKNFIATKNIFYSTFEANKNAKFIFCSSSQIFKKKYGLVDEKSKVEATTNYTKFRINSHNLMMKFKKKNNIKYTNIILFNHDSKFRNKKFIIPKVINAILNKDLIFLKKIIKMNVASDFSHALDFCEGIKKIMFNSLNLDTIILSSKKLISLNKIISFIIKKNKLDIKLLIKDKKIKGLIGNNMLARNKINWSPKKNIFIAANEIYKFYKQNRYK
jgi:GDP-D-mannose dehydratase